MGWVFGGSRRVGQQHSVVVYGKSGRSVCRCHHDRARARSHVWNEQRSNERDEQRSNGRDEHHINEWDEQRSNEWDEQCGHI